MPVTERDRLAALVRAAGLRLSADDLTALLEATGFRVRRHLMVDVLPYPHVLYIGEAV